MTGAYDELQHTRRQLHECRSHEADLALEAERLRGRVAHLEDNRRGVEWAWDRERSELAQMRLRDQLLAEVEALCRQMGWTLMHVGRYHPAGAEPEWEATAHRCDVAADHEHGSGASMQIALTELKTRLKQRGSDAAPESP